MPRQRTNYFRRTYEFPDDFPERLKRFQRETAGVMGFCTPSDFVRAHPMSREWLTLLCESTFDVYLNDRAYWRNVPAAVWDYKLGGYQVLKKWLSYREEKVLGRSMLPGEVQHFTDTARRIGGILMMVGER